jgi:hypothetical protein
VRGLELTGGGVGFRVRGLELTGGGVGFRVRGLELIGGGLGFRVRGVIQYPHITAQNLTTLSPESVFTQ